MEDGSIRYDELKPEWTDFSKTAHYQTYDITDLLRKGENAVGAQVPPAGGTVTSATESMAVTK